VFIDPNDPIALEVVRAYVVGKKQKGETIGLTSGCFDLIHYHHITFFTRCRRFCDHLFVGVDSDELVREVKGDSRPLIYDSRRAAMVDALKPVAFTFIINSVADFGRAAEIIRPTVIFKGEDFWGREAEIVGKEYAGKILIIRDLTDHMSTTAIMEEAARQVLLARGV